VRLAESVSPPACALTVTDAHRINNHTAFRCAHEDELTSMVRFGEVVFDPETARDLYLPAGMIRQWQDSPPDVPAAPEAPVDQGASGASLQLSADRHGLALNVVDALAKAGVQLLADSSGAVFHVRDDASNTHVAMRADAGGFALQVIDRGEAKVIMQADSTGVRMNVRDQP
jgi:hypothetical protein